MFRSVDGDDGKSAGGNHRIARRVLLSRRRQAEKIPRDGIIGRDEAQGLAIQIFFRIPVYIFIIIKNIKGVFKMPCFKSTCRRK